MVSSNTNRDTEVSCNEGGRFMRKQKLVRTMAGIMSICLMTGALTGDVYKRQLVSSGITQNITDPEASSGKAFYVLSYFSRASCETYFCCNSRRIHFLHGILLPYYLLLHVNTFISQLDKPHPAPASVYLLHGNSTLLQMPQILHRSVFPLRSFR